MCRGPIYEYREIGDVLREAEAAADDNNAGMILESEQTWDVFSSKIMFMITELRRRLAEDPSTKTLIFSQWRGVLDMSERALAHHNISSLRIDGTITNHAVRAKFQTRFNTDPDITAMVCSLNCSSEGINLQGANVVFILDPWWTPARAKQAGNRAHRVGQTRPVEIMHLIARDTVEERILQLEQSKQNIVDGVNGQGALAPNWDSRVRNLFSLNDN